MSVWYVTGGRMTEWAGIDFGKFTMAEPTLTPEDNELERLKDAAKVPPEPVPDAEGLPDDVRDGNIEDDGSTVDHHEGD